jgi:hypothetical protein
MSINYKDKYLKYKTKYLQLFNTVNGVCSDDLRITKTEIDAFIERQRNSPVRVLYPYRQIDNDLKLEEVDVKGVAFPKMTLNPTIFNDKKIQNKKLNCSYCYNVYSNKINFFNVNTFTSVSPHNCKYPYPNKKCTTGNMYALIYPTIHISIPWDNTYVRDTTEQGLGSQFIFGFKGEDKKIMLKIMIQMYDAALDWANNELARLYNDGILDKLYPAQICKLDQTGKYYDIEMINKKASEGGAPIGTIFPFFHYPNSESHNLGREFEHIHLQVPLRITDNGFSYDDLLSHKGTNPNDFWVRGLQFMGNNISGIKKNDLSEGDNSGHSFDYTFNKLYNNCSEYLTNQPILNNENQRMLNTLPRNLSNDYYNIVDFNVTDVKDLDNISISNNFINNLKSVYDVDTNLYLVTIPKGTVFYRGYHNIKCNQYNQYNDINNNYVNQYTWYSTKEIAHSYAIRAIQTKEAKAQIKMFEDISGETLKQTDKAGNLYQFDGFIMAYKTKKDLILIDTTIKHNLGLLQKLFDRVNYNRSRDTNFPKTYNHYNNSTRNNTERYINLRNKHQKDNVGLLLYYQRLSLSIATGYNMTLLEQFQNSITNNFKLFNSNHNFSGRKKYSRRTIYNYIINSDDKIQDQYGPLYNNLNKLSTMYNDTLWIDLLARICGKVFEKQERVVYKYSKNKKTKRTVKLYKPSNEEIELAAYKKIHGYVARNIPSLGHYFGSFHPEICLFSNLEDISGEINDDNLLIEEDYENEYTMCGNSENNTKINDDTKTNAVTKIINDIRNGKLNHRFRFIGNCSKKSYMEEQNNQNEWQTKQRDIKKKQKQQPVQPPQKQQSVQPQKKKRKIESNDVNIIENLKEYVNYNEFTDDYIYGLTDFQDTLN